MQLFRAWRARRRPQRIPWAELEDLLALSSGQFEEAVAAILRELGFRRVRCTGQSGDLSVDITCRGRDNRLIAVQCKRYTSKPVGSVEVQTFLGMATVHHKAQEALFITTSDFTRPAYALAEQHDDLSLWNGLNLAELLANILGAPGRSIDDPAAALACDGLSTALLASEVRASDAGIAAITASVDDASKCPCHTFDIRWAAYRGEGGRPVLVCPYCERFATPEEVHEAMIRGACGVEREIPGLEPLREAARMRRNAETDSGLDIAKERDRIGAAIAEEDARLGLLFVHDSLIRRTRENAARIALTKALGRDPTDTEVSELSLSRPSQRAERHDCSGCGAEMQRSQRLGAYWCQACSHAEFHMLDQFVRLEVYRPEVSGPPSPEWVQEFLSDM